MHTTKIDELTFHHNGDYDGEVIIMGANVTETEFGPEVRVDFNALKQLVANCVRDRMISAYESASSDEILFDAVAKRVQLLND